MSSRLAVSLRRDSDGPSSFRRPLNEKRCSPPNPLFDRADNARFKLGNELQRLRQEVTVAEVRYADALALGNFEHAAEMKGVIIEGQDRDADFIYHLATCEMNEAAAEGNQELVQRFRDEREAARRSMPQFNLHGLWVGMYGASGYEIVNITYAGDTLVATKVTGDVHVPRGEVSFTADLRPLVHGDPDALPPVEMTEAAAAQWGAAILPRFVGQGRVADRNFRDQAWVEGQLVLVGEHFSFAWVPQRHQIFFGRPSSEQVLRMLRDDLSREDEEVNSRAAAERMYSGNIDKADTADRNVRRILRRSDLKDMKKKSAERKSPPISTRLQNLSNRQSRNRFGRVVRIQLKKMQRK